MTRKGGPGVWRDRRAVIFVGVSLVSGFSGTSMMLVAGIWVLDLTGSSSLAALANLGVYLPTLIAPLLGAVVDRLPRRSVLIWTNTATALAVLALVTVRSPGQVWLIYAVMLGYGVCLVLVDAADAALLPAVLPDEQLGTVNGLRVSAQESTKLVAPLVGAGIFAAQGGTAVTLVTVVALLATAGLYALVGTGPAVDRGTPEAAIRCLLREVRDGLGFLRRERAVRATVLAGSVAIGMSGLGTAGLYAVVTEELHRPATTLGLLTSLQGVGSILGGLAAGRLMARRGEPMTGGLGALLFAAGAAIQATAGWPAVLAGAVLVGVGLPWTLLAAVTTVQRRTPQRLLGRVSATATALLFAPVAIATPAGAAIVLLDHRLPLIVAAVVGAAAGAPLLASARRP